MSMPRSQDSINAILSLSLKPRSDAVWCGSRFLASSEANAHADFKRKVVEADVGDTVVTTIYGPEWPDQPMRIIVNEGARVAIGREADAIRDAEGQTMGTTMLGGQRVPLPRHSAILPMHDFEGDIEQACLTAGESVGNIEEIMPAAEIVRRMSAEAAQALNKFR
jgi:NAD(P)H-dependent flavin oxidoreductase YrpB (nitropropane dioxygenase family)